MSNINLNETGPTLFRTAAPITRLKPRATSSVAPPKPATGVRLTIARPIILLAD